MRHVRALVIGLSFVLMLGLAPGRVVAEDPFDSPIRVLDTEDDDPGLRRIWLGISKGLEQASLPRAGRDVLASDATAQLEALAAKKPPLVFVLGAEAAKRVGDRLAGIPRVFVDTAWMVTGDPLPPPPQPDAPAAVVRGVVYPARLSKVLRELFGEQPSGRFSWIPDTDERKERAKRLATAAGIRHVPSGEVDVLLHLRLSMGEETAPLSTLRRLARETQTPLVSDDLGHWGRGASVLVIADHHLLGRVAADVGRQLLADRGPEPRVILRDVRAAEVRVDIRAAEEQGLELPVPFLASVDELRDAPFKPDRPGTPR